MSNVVTREETAVVAQSEAVSFIQMIERASRDPNVDIDKMERLMAMHERMINRQSEVAFNAALAAMQTELPELPEHGAIKNKTGGVQSKYVLWEDLNQIIKPILSKHGFALTFRTGNEGPNIVVTGILSHTAGHSVQSTMHVPLDVSGSKNNVQGLGSSTSYGKRYVASALLNLTSRGEDNDGRGGGGMSEETIADWKAAIEEASTIDAWEDVWARCAKATTAARDVPAHEELKAAAAAKRKTLKAAKPEGTLI